MPAPQAGARAGARALREEVSVWSGLWMTPCPVFQGHSVHTFDLKLVWVDPEQDG